VDRSQLQRVTLTTGITVPFLEQGDPAGRHLVLLHAWVESLGCFDRLLPRLPAPLHVLAMDQRGHGGASKPAGGYSLASLAADTIGFLDALHIRSAVLVGSSSGGYLAQQVALAAPDRVSALVLVGAPRSLQGRPPFAEDVEQLTDPLDPDWVRESITWFPRFHEVPRHYLADRVHDGLAAPAHVWRQGLAGLMDAVPPTTVGTIGTPTLVIHGGRDDLLGPEAGAELAAAIPGAALVVYPDTGHLVLWEQPERLAADITAFATGMSD
jgi:pimeloyl-ACP methyl ester carboxylesterase